MKCEWCDKEVEDTYTAYADFKSYDVCEDCYFSNNLCDACHKEIEGEPKFVKINIRRKEAKLCKACSTKKLCENCMTDSNVKTVNIGGKASNLCDKCADAMKRGVCRICGEPMSMFMSIQGVCTACIQTDESAAESELKLNGIVHRFLQSNNSEISDEEFIEWITGYNRLTQHNQDKGIKISTTKKYSEELRNNMLKAFMNDIIIDNPYRTRKEFNWTAEDIDSHFTELMGMMSMKITDIIDGTTIVAKKDEIDIENEGVKTVPGFTEDGKCRQFFKTIAVYNVRAR